MTDRIKITCAADSNFFRFIPTMINGVQQNTDAELDVGVFIQNVEEKYKQTLRDLFPNINFSFWDIPNNAFEGLPFKLALAPMAYARVLMAKLSGWDKFIYLDVDIAVTGDLSELYNTDIGDAYLGGCYISGGLNSGVLLINGKQWIKEDIETKVLEYAAKHQPKEADQASIEAICSSNSVKLDPKWNVIVDPIWGRKSTLNPDYYNKAAITHYITGFKPWNLGYFFLPKALQKRWKQYVIKTDLPINMKRECKIIFYQALMIIKVFVIDRIIPSK